MQPFPSLISHLAKPAPAQKSSRRQAASALTASFLVASLALAGCGSSTYSINPVSGLPPQPNPANSNTYIGTQSPLNWRFIVDDTQNAFSYQSLPADSSKPVTSSGSFVPRNGFLDLGDAGLAIELPGSGALLRPGDNTHALAVLLDQEDCFALTAKQRFLMEGMVHTTAAASPFLVYRRADAVATTAADGSSWSFADAEYISPTGSQTSLTYQGQSSPNAFSGPCSVVNGSSAVTIDTSGAYTLPTTFRFSRSGLAVADYATFTSAVGIAQPVSAISTKSLYASNFRGFQVEYSTTSITQPISFVPASDGSSSLMGGVYPNDDLSQPPSTDDSFQFGSVSSTMNGLFPSATIVVLDPHGGCAANGVSSVDLGITADGVATCRLHLAATVGQINGKAFIVATGIDFTVPSSSAPDIQFYLIQQ